MSDDQQPIRCRRVTITLPPRHLRLLATWCGELAINRSDMLRRLIDDHDRRLRATQTPPAASVPRKG